MGAKQSVECVSYVHTNNEARYPDEAPACVSTDSVKDRENLEDLEDWEFVDNAEIPKQWDMHSDSVIPAIWVIIDIDNLDVVVLGDTRNS